MYENSLIFKINACKNQLIANNNSFNDLAVLYVSDYNENIQLFEKVMESMNWEPEVIKLRKEESYIFKIPDNASKKVRILLFGIKQESIEKQFELKNHSLTKSENCNYLLTHLLKELNSSKELKKELWQTINQYNWNT